MKIKPNEKTQNDEFQISSISTNIVNEEKNNDLKKSYLFLRHKKNLKIKDQKESINMESILMSSSKKRKIEKLRKNYKKIRSENLQRYQRNIQDKSNLTQNALDEFSPYINSYKNYMLKNTWQKCNSIYESFNKEYKLKLNTLQRNKTLIKSSSANTLLTNKYTDFQTYNINNSNGIIEKQQGYIIKLKKGRGFFENLKLKKNKNENKKNNYIDYINKVYNLNFRNKGFSNLIESKSNIPLESIIIKDELNKEKKFLLLGDSNYNNINKKNRSIIYIDKMKTNILSPKKIGNINLLEKKLLKYKINFAYYIGKLNKIKKENENNKLILKLNKNTNNNNNSKIQTEPDQSQLSIYNFFEIKKIFGINNFNIYGLIKGIGKKAISFSGLFKNLIIKFLTEESNYLKTVNIDKKIKNFELNEDLIEKIIFFDNFKMIKNIIYNNIINEMNKKSHDIYLSGAMFTIIIIIKNKIINVSIGNINIHYIYNNINDNYIKNNTYIKDINTNSKFHIFNDIKIKGCIINKNEDLFGNICIKLNHINKDINNFIIENDINYPKIFCVNKLKEYGFNDDIEIKVNNFNNIINDTNNNNCKSFYRLSYILLGNKEIYEQLKVNLFIKKINDMIYINNNNKSSDFYNTNLQMLCNNLVQDSINNYLKYFDESSFKEKVLSIIHINYI